MPNDDADIRATAVPPRPIVILGPTAGGKSALAVTLGERLGGEVLGADSMQVYRHMDAGTAKPAAALRARVRHHLIDIVEPSEPFTAADWVRRAEGVIGELQGRGVRPIVVGGTHLYLRALLEGMLQGPGRDEAFRAGLAGMPAAELHGRLREVDAEAAARIAPADRQRITRALEVFHLTGVPLSKQQTHWTDEAGRGYRFNPILIGLDWEREAINRRINLRVKAMFYPEKVEPVLAADVCINGESLPDEARRLDAAGVLGPQAREALGYKQVLTMRSVDEAFEKTKVLTRRFAKQQRTWFKRFRFVTWLAAGGMDDVALADAAVEVVRGNETGE